MNKVKRFITARGISLGLILTLAGLMYVSTLIPQQIDSVPGTIDAWRQKHAGLLWLIDAIQLHSIYTQMWFAFIILCAVFSLGISSFDQLTVSRKRLFSTAAGDALEVAVAVPGELLADVARSCGYRRVRGASDKNLKFIKNPWGYFGVLLLHIGMTLVILVSLYVSLTGRQGMLLLVEGEQRDQRQLWDAEQHGWLSSPLQLPEMVRLDKVRVAFDSKKQPSEVSSDISFIDQSGRVTSMTASINRILNYHGLRIYHAAQYGTAFTVTFINNAGMSHTEKIMIQQPLDLAKAGYSDDFSVSWSPYLFEAKYFADFDRKNMLSDNPELVVRLLDRKMEMARVSLTQGIQGVLGEYRIRFDRAEKWSKLIIVDRSGMSAIFAGFAIIMLGGLIHYMLPPRELIGIVQKDGLCRVYWRATAFKDFYCQEHVEVVAKFEKEVGP